MAFVETLTRAGRSIARFSASDTRSAEAALVLTVGVLLAAAAVTGGDPGPVPEALELLHRVDVNAAPWHELVNLPGIGEVRAREIVRDREARGPFRTAGELERVHGIGPATVRALTEYLRGK